MFIAKITHCPFREPHISKETMTEVTEITSAGMNYLQFCSVIGQIAFTFGLTSVEIRFIPDDKK